MRPMVLFTFCLFLAIPLSASEQEQAESQSKLSEQQKSQLTALLPDPERWDLERVGEVDFYVPENLHEYINGAADIFFQYDFENLLSEEYKKGEFELTLDIYNMGSSMNAFGIYSAERSPNYQFTGIGVQASISEYGINFLQGPYYVKISAFGPREMIDSIMKPFAKDVSERIGETGEFPEELKFFLPNHKIEHSEKFIKKNPLGYEFLGPTFLASYQFGDTEALLSITPACCPDGALRKLKNLEEHFRKSDTTIQSITIAEKPALEIDSQYRGTLYALATGRYCLILRKPPESAKEFLTEQVSYLYTKVEHVSQIEQE